MILSGQKSLFCDLGTIEQRRPQGSGFAGGSRGPFCHLFSQPKNSFVSHTRIFEAHGTIMGAQKSNFLTRTIVNSPLKSNIPNKEKPGIIDTVSSVYKSVYPFILATILMFDATS